MNIYQTTDAAEVYHFMDRLGELAIGIRSMPKPVIASVNGVAAGGGANIALACDLIIASEEARFIQIYATKNLHPDVGATYFLPRLVGTARAMELLLTGRMVDAEEAVRIGLVNSVVPADQLEGKTKELAMNIAKVSPVVAHMIKVSTYEGAVSDLPAALENETRGAVIIMSSGIWKESLKASNQSES
jgi:2-(1,2-epoxy-1,2-dihydrophenyl)acetyl-CoA isomerase